MPANPQQSSATGRRLPTFGEVSAQYIETRIQADGATHPDIKYLRLRRQTFIDVCGDRPIDQYYPRDLQHYVNEMQYWPANVSKRAELKNKTTLEIINSNRSKVEKPISRKTLQDGYVANIRTMARFGMAEFDYRDPFSGARIKWPPMPTSKPREGIDLEILDRVFSTGVASGLLDEAMLPLLSYLTSRRLALLTYLRGRDIRKKYGVYVAQVNGMVQIHGTWRRVPIKTEDSGTYFVLHRFLEEIGFVEWSMRQDGWLFAAAHEHPDPSKYMSKVMNRLLRRCGAAGGNVEVFHSLRGDAITSMRKHAVDPRARRLQAGHEPGDDVHERYGFRALLAEECRTLAHLSLPHQINWSVFRGLDFDRLAANRRTPGRRRRMVGT